MHRPLSVDSTLLFIGGYLIVYNVIPTSLNKMWINYVLFTSLLGALSLDVGGNQMPDAQPTVRVATTNITPEQLIKILENPIFRDDDPQSEEVPFMPSFIKVEETKAASDGAEDANVPARYLQVPAESSPESFVFVPRLAAVADASGWSPVVSAGRQSAAGKLSSGLPLQSSMVPSNLDIEQTPSLPTRSEIAVPSKYLEVPLPDSVPNTNFYADVPAQELQLPIFEPLVHFKQPFGMASETTILAPYPSLTLELQPPKLDTPKFGENNPTLLYPKKFNKAVEYKVTPMKLKNYTDTQGYEKTMQKMAKKYQDLYKDNYLTQQDLQQKDKNRIKFEDMQLKKQIKQEDEQKKQQNFLDATVAQTFTSPEQETSETGSYNNGHNSFVAPEANAASPGLSDDEGPSERTEFRMHGLQGPHSYKFGYDTGKGKNRQFRYEERNNDGHVKGHYGYYDRSGKLQVVNYDAHPEHGFHAEGPFGKV